MFGIVFDVDIYEEVSYYILGILIPDATLYTQVDVGYIVNLLLPNDPGITEHDGNFGWWENEYVLIETGAYNDGITDYSYFILVGLGVPSGTEFECLSGSIRFMAGYGGV